MINALYHVNNLFDCQHLSSIAEPSCTDYSYWELLKLIPQSRINTITNISYSVLFSVHFCRPSAWATPMQGIVSLQQLH